MVPHHPKADGITLVDEPWIKPFYRCNIWHVQGSKRGMVVDFGLGAVPLREQVALLSERNLWRSPVIPTLIISVRLMSLAAVTCMLPRRTF